jgi:hypothetical protein
MRRDAPDDLHVDARFSCCASPLRRLTMTGASDARVIAAERADDERMIRIATAIIACRRTLMDLPIAEKVEAVEILRAFVAIEERGHLPQERANQ